MTTILALGAVLFGAVILLVLFNDWRLHRREYDRMESVLFIAIGAGSVCSLAAGLRVLI